MDNLLNQEIFQGLSEDTKNKILKSGYIRKNYSGGKLIKFKGQPIDEIAIVSKGCLKTNEYRYDGKELNSNYFFSGDAFPFYLIYGGYDNYPYNVCAYKKSEVLWLDKEAQVEIIKKDPNYCINVLKFVSKYTCYTKLLLRCGQYYKVSERVAYWLLEINEKVNYGKIPSSQEVLADILMVNRSSLNQELRKLEEMEVIKLEHKKIWIKDRKYLESLI